MSKLYQKLYGDKEIPKEVEKQVLENLSRWQDKDNPLCIVSDEEWDLLYQIEESVKKMYEVPPAPEPEPMDPKKPFNDISEFLFRFFEVEEEINQEELYPYKQVCKYLENQLREFEDLLGNVDKITSDIDELKTNYNQVSGKINSLHDVSEQLMKQQALLKSKKEEITSRLQTFTLYEALNQNISRKGINFNSAEFLRMLDQINSSLDYLKNHPQYKESYKYQLQYDNLLSSTVSNVVRFVNGIITEATNQVLNMDLKLIGPESNVDSAFSLYYGKFHNAALKTSSIINYLEEKADLNEAYERSLSDCHRAYFTQRAPILQAAVSKALLDLRDKYKTDHGILFRSACLFITKVCQDEAACYKYFFKNPSKQLSDYLFTLTQNLYDVLRPCLITINHIEVLTELCTILKEMISGEVQNNDALDQFINIINQLLQDVEERLVFRTNIFFQYDLSAYEPSAGDLAYPEKLEQMEDIAEELIERRSESRTSSVSGEPQEVPVSASTVGQFRSYTGNSPADLHGMWYPTVKRTLVCLSRLYICLDREIFQGVAQEGLLICVKTIEKAADKITERKSPLDGKLFQIKHLLIIREQIAPFQADFAVKEVTLDFSSMKNAAVGLMHNRKNIFSLSSNNALLEFLLEGTPKVKEYLVDSRKEIDKQLKSSCEAFIANTTHLLIGNLLQFLQKAEQQLKLAQQANDFKEIKQQFPPQMIAGFVTAAQRNIKAKVPEVQKSMRLYLANRETEFILFRPIKNNLINAFIQTEQFVANAKYTGDDSLLIACPSPEQLNVLVSSVSLSAEQEQLLMTRRRQSTKN